MRLCALLAAAALLLPLASTFCPPTPLGGLQLRPSAPLRGAPLHSPLLPPANRPELPGLALQMRGQQYDTYIPTGNFMRRSLVTRIYSRMAISAQGKQTAEEADSVVEEAEEKAKDPIQELTEQMMKLDGKAEVSVEKRKKAPRKQKESEASDEVHNELAVAFAAFGNALLRTKGRVRFATVCQAFREEFPTLASEERISNQTLGRRIQSWYEKKTGKALRKSVGGSYVGLSMVNPRFTTADLTALRAAQALFEPDMRKKLERLGVSLTEPQAAELVSEEDGEVGGKGKFAYEQRERTRNEKRVKVLKNKQGKVIKVIRRGDPEKGRKEKVLVDKTPPIESRVQRLRKTGPVVRMCIEAFSNTLLTNKGSCTFDEVKTAVHAQFPLLANKERMTDSYLGRVLGDWYKAKYGSALVRRKTIEMGNITRAQVPYTDLSIMLPSSPGVEMQQLNEAKVALRKALKMEGVGVLVRKDSSSDYRVALIARGSPAAVEGSMMIGDLLIAVDSKPVDTLDLQELADAVLGARGTRVKLTLARGTELKELETYTVDLERSDKPIPSAQNPVAQTA